MVRLDRYMLSQLLVLFGFFSLVLVAVFWINRAVSLFDRLISDGQSALVFLEFTALGLPKLITVVLPIASFCASVYVTNRLNNESELTVMQATGAGPFRLARPVLVFGVIVFLMASTLYHVLLPMAQDELNQREAEISQNATARLLTEGTFLTPTRGVTFYTRTIDEDGVLRDVFLSDARAPNEDVIYTAAEAYLISAQDNTTLIMLNGVAQRLGKQDNRLSTANFRDFSFDISSLVKTTRNQRQQVTTLTTFQMMQPWQALRDMTGQSIGTLTEEFHARFAQSLFCIVAALLGFTTLMISNYSRFGVWREALLAFTLLVVIDGARSTLVDPVRDDPSLWPILYVPAMIGALISLGMLWFAGRTRWIRQRFRKAAP